MIVATTFPEQLKARFRSETFLGRGKRKLVFRAYDTHESRWVAVKVIMHKQPDVVYEELKPALQVTDHLNLARVFDFGLLDTEDGGRAVYVIEELLDQILADVAPIRDLRYLASCLAGLAAGLAFLHERRIVHRDLKPDNCGLLRSIPKLFDFGTVSSARDASIRYGAPHTRSPEVYKKQVKTYSSAQDIWAFGCSAFFLGSGDYPFLTSEEIEEYSMAADVLWYDVDGDKEQSRKTIGDLETNIVRRMESWPDRVKSQLSGLREVGNVIGECLAIEPDRRPSSEVLRQKFEEIHRTLTEAPSADKRTAYLLQRAMHLQEYAEQVSVDDEFAAELKLDLVSAMRAMAERLRKAKLTNEGNELKKRAEQLANGLPK